VREALHRWNSLSEEEAISEMLEQCGSRAWATAMARARPISDSRLFLETSHAAWTGLAEEDRREALAAHPRIGDRSAVGEPAREQASVARASKETREALARANREYEKRFGGVFLVCATGKTAEEILALCRQRLHNDPETERRVAADEQRKIMRLRLERWLGEQRP